VHHIKKTLIVPILTSIIFLTAVDSVCALKIERPTVDCRIDRDIGSQKTNGNASVSLGTYAYKYNTPQYPYVNDYVSFNVSMICNTRIGIKYDFVTYPWLEDWMFENYTGSYILQEFPNCGDNWGTWADLPSGFRFHFYGGKYRNCPEESVYSKVWICTNGFLSFDLSNSTNCLDNIPSRYSPNGIVAPLWTDLVIDSQSEIVTKTYAAGHVYFIVIWKNALHKSTGKRLTFSVALQGYNWVDEENPYTHCGNIYMAYQDVASVDGIFTYGIEDLEGLRGTGNWRYGSELGSQNGKTLVFYQSTSLKSIQHLILEFEDQNWQNAGYDILTEYADQVFGMNVRTKIDPAPRSNTNMMLGKSIAGAAGCAVGVGGAFAGYYGLAFGLAPFAAPVSCVLVAWGFYDWYVQSQYNSIEWRDIKDWSNGSEQQAYIKVPASGDGVFDASLSVGFYWAIKDNYTRYHNLTTRATVEYMDEDGRLANVTTSVNVELKRDNNNDFSTADEIQAGTYGGDPMLYLAGDYDQKDFYKIFLVEADQVSVSMRPPIGQNFDLYLYDTAKLQRDSSTNGGDAPELVTRVVDSTGYWYIEVRWNGGQGFYNMTVKVREPGGCPFVYVWNGGHYVIENNILPISETNNGIDVDDYYRLEGESIPMYKNDRHSYYSLQLREFEHEHSFIDQAKLLAIDHTPDVNVAATLGGGILTYQSPTPPIVCTDNYGNSRLNEISQIDGDIENPATYFDGQAGDWLILEFDAINSNNAKLILRDDKKCYECCIDVQILNNQGEWQQVARLVPRAYWSIEAVDLSAYVTFGRGFSVRLLWTSPHRLDFVGLDTTPNQSLTIEEATLLMAMHSKDGLITQELQENDGIYAELKPRQQISLVFRLSSPPADMKRTFIFYTNGYYYTIQT